MLKFKIHLISEHLVNNILVYKRGNMNNGDQRGNNGNEQPEESGAAESSSRTFESHNGNLSMIGCTHIGRLQINGQEIASNINFPAGGMELSLRDPDETVSGSYQTNYQSNHSESLATVPSFTDSYFCASWGSSDDPASAPNSVVRTAKIKSLCFSECRDIKGGNIENMYIQSYGVVKNAKGISNIYLLPGAKLEFAHKFSDSGEPIKFYHISAISRESEVTTGIPIESNSTTTLEGDLEETFHLKPGGSIYAPADSESIHPSYTLIGTCEESDI